MRNSLAASQVKKIDIKKSDKVELSVLMCVYNGERLLSQTIESVINQTFFNFEFVIVNDGSIDNTLKVLKEYENKDKRIRIIDKPNSGLIDSLNIGLSECKSEIIIRHDAEDISHQDRLKILHQYMSKMPDVSCIATLSFFLDKHYNIIGFSPLMPGLNLNDALDKNQSKIWHPNVVYRKSHVLKAGGYPNVLHAEDHALWKMMRKHNMNFYLLHQPLYGYLKEPSGISYENMSIQVRAVLEVGNLKPSIKQVDELVNRNKIRNQYLYGFPVETNDQPLKWVVYFKLLSLYQKFIIFKYRKYIKGFLALNK